MYSEVIKSKENSNRAVANSILQTKKKDAGSSDFADNRRPTNAVNIMQQFNWANASGPTLQRKSPVLQRRVFTRSQIEFALSLVTEFKNGRLTREQALETLYSYDYSDSDLFEMAVSLKGLGKTGEGLLLEYIVDENLNIKELAGTTGAVGIDYQNELVGTGEDTGEGGQEAEEGLNNTLHDGFTGDGDEIDDYTAAMLDGIIESPPLDVIQNKRSGNTDTGPKTYTSSSSGKVTDIGYTTDPKGSIDFDKGWKQTGGKKNRQKNVYAFNLSGTVDIDNKKKPGYLPTQKGWRQIAKATRGQHFAVANKAYGKSASWKHKGTTWHHLPDKFEMVLVDTKVHSKHGHNGGFLLWQ